MFKKLLSVMITGVLVFSMSSMVLASEITNLEQTVEKEVKVKGESNLQNEINKEITIRTSELRETGEIINVSKRVSLSSGQVIDNKKGSFTGTLTDSNTWDFYLFSSETPFSSISKIATKNSGYTMTLGVYDYSNSQIKLTNYVTLPNQLFRVNFEQPGIYAWVIQSSNATYGDNYQLSYNMLLSPSTNLIYTSDNLQKLYAITDQKLTINGDIKNIDYKYDSEYELYPIGGGEKHWNKTHVWMENANVKAIHVGGCKYYESKVLRNYPNSIVLSIQPGGLFTHNFSQNPPYYNWYDNDAAGIKTPRAITSEDGPQYLIYDLSTDKVVEFASGLTQPWSRLGDKHDLSIY